MGVEPTGNLVTLVAVDDTGKLHAVLVDDDGKIIVAP